MGMVVVISLPFILFCILLGFGCYFLGRAKGRQDVKTNAQIYGIPTPPPGTDTAFSYPSPPQNHFKPPAPAADNSANEYVIFNFLKLAVILSIGCMDV
ncbi:hypothetical protein CMV_015385 [Castanea mollissima]|uniref:Transmembrane protein n=1 Tax=Castanea mollissima TaxID=60419 RepID=A0A8J4QW93_9ROSI|nr:hypothetical protein CMV_015385 [Castanea mollissima]